MTGNNSPITGKANTMSDNDNKTPYASIIAALNLLPGASETDILGRLGRLRDLEVQASAALGVTDSAQLVGAIRGVKAKADLCDTAQAELAQVKGERDKQRFESLVAKAQTDRKLTPAESKQYADVFVARLAEGRGAEYVAEVEGYINAAPRKFAEPVIQPTARGASGAPTHNGKTYAELAFAERARLSKSDPELYRLMKTDHDASQAV